MKVTLNTEISLKNKQNETVNTKITYLVCFDRLRFDENYLAKYPNLAEATNFASEFNKSDSLVKEYGRVHVEKQTVIKEFIQII